MHTMYEELIKLVRKAGVLDSVAGVLHWDHLVMMPEGGIRRRTAQLTAVVGLSHEMRTSARIGELISTINRGTLGEEQLAQVREIERNYKRQTKVPTSIVDDLSQLSMEGNDAWAKAREDNDFAKFLPYLEKGIELKRATALAIDSAADPYETLMQEYEPDSKVADLEKHFSEISQAIVPLIDEIGRLPAPDTSILHSPIPESVQMPYLKQLIGKMGYDFSRGRLDTATHPFCGEAGRITTRFSDGWADSIGSSVHEMGHAMYEHNLPEEHFGTPLGESRSMGVHESQSRLWENHVGRSKGFIAWQLEALKAAYAPRLDGLDAETMYRMSNVVEHGFIRTKADELTYPLHIALRFEIERALIDGSLKASDLPTAWNDGMKKYLGIVPPTDTLGCLQDIHWSDGSFGYFPTYTYGSMISAQMWKSIERALPIDQQIRNGDFGPLQMWLKENIHRHGCRYNTKELVERSTGEEPHSSAYIKYLSDKFRTLYGI